MFFIPILLSPSHVLNEMQHYLLYAEAYTIKKYNTKHYSYSGYVFHQFAAFDQPIRATYIDRTNEFHVTHKNIYLETQKQIRHNCPSTMPAPDTFVSKHSHSCTLQIPIFHQNRICTIKNVPTRAVSSTKKPIWSFRSSSFSI